MRVAPARLVVEARAAERAVRRVLPHIERDGVHLAHVTILIAGLRLGPGALDDLDEVVAELRLDRAVHFAQRVLGLPERCLVLRVERARVIPRVSSVRFVPFVMATAFLVILILSLEF